MLLLPGEEKDAVVASRTTIYEATRNSHFFLL